ncbi:MAG: ABC transporter ATP-binding protein [Clostridiales bacterium]|nr:ABC transporter ATP-binding protein [Clostridiales bacterium]
MKKENNHKHLGPKNTKRTIIRLFSYFKYNMPLFIVGMISIVLSSVSAIASNAILSPIIDSFVNKAEIAVIIKYIGIMIVFVISISIFQYFGSLSMARLAQRTVHRIRQEMFSHMEKLSISFFDTHSHGELMSTYTNDVDMLNQSLEQSLSQIIVSIISVVGTFIMMLVLSPILTLVVIGMLVVMLFSVKFVGQRSAKNFRRQQGALADMNGYIEEMMSGQKVVKVFNFEDRAIKDFNKRNEDLRQASTQASTFGVMLMPIMGNLSYVLYALVSMGGALLVIGGKMTIGNIAAFLQYTRTISRPITEVSNQLNTLFASLAGAERIFAILDETPEIDQGHVSIETKDNNKYWKLAQENGSDKLVEVHGDIVLNNVDFGYLPGQEVLKDISLFAKPGQKIAFVGSTGAGKTTITNLINRFYEINGGEILYDGIDIKSIKKFDLRSTLSIVLQDVHLFEGTIADNIRYGRLDATDEEVVEAAKLANAHYFIKNLPYGYKTVLDVDGQNLSQGERQLLSIARAAVADPTILILDEATSSVDTRTEKLISEGMDKLMKGRTTLVIAHRLSTVRDADAIMVLEGGVIIERGSHEELMRQKGRYYDLNMGIIKLD